MEPASAFSLPVVPALLRFFEVELLPAEVFEDRAAGTWQCTVIDEQNVLSVAYIGLNTLHPKFKGQNFALHGGRVFRHFGEVSVVITSGLVRLIKVENSQIFGILENVLIPVKAELGIFPTTRWADIE